MGLFNQDLKIKSKEKKPSFEEYYKTIPELKNDTSNYDLRAAYQNLPYEDLKAFAEGDAHLPDTYKLPTHPSFSEESIYSNDKVRGGRWEYENGHDVFIPSQLNIDNFGGVDAYRKWFRDNEPGVILKFQNVEIKKGLFNTTIER